MRKLPPLAQLRAFEAAARHLSFQKAAAELAVTPTAISHQVRLLEDWCGQALFRRRPRPVSLTEAGTRLFPVVRDGLDSFARAVSTVREEGTRTPLRVTTTNAFASRWLVPRLPLWRKESPETGLEVIGSDLVIDLNAGEADFAIRYGRPPPAELVAHELFKDRYVPVCSPSLLTGGNAILCPADLARFVLIDNAWRTTFHNIPTWRIWLAAARNAGFDAPEFADCKTIGFTEETHAIEAAIAGQGIAICSDIVVGRELNNGDLVRVLDIALPGERYYLARLPDHPRRSTIDAFLRWVKTVA